MRAFIRNLRQAIFGKGAEESEQRAMPDVAPIVKLSHAIIQQAVCDGATHIEIRPGDAYGCKVIYTVDGEEKEAMSIPEAITFEIIRRFKVMLSLDILSKKPEEKVWTFEHGGSEYALEGLSMPNKRHETILMTFVPVPVAA